MKDLIERLVQTTAPDRDLDADIACRLFGETAHGYWAWQARRPKGIEKKPARGYWLIYAKNVTGSTDAALTLVPDDYYVVAIHQLPKSWTVKIGHRIEDREMFEEECRTLPATISAVALTARAAITTTDREQV